MILNFDQSKSVNYDHIWACLTGLFWSCACLLFWAFVFNFNSNVNFFSHSELAAPLASRLGEGYAAAPAQLAGWSVRRAADRTSMPVSTARGADAASAGRRRRRQSPGACAVRGPLKPQCAVAGSRLADILLALPDGDSWALRFGALPIGRAGPGAAGAAHSVGGHRTAVGSPAWVTSSCFTAAASAGRWVARIELDTLLLEVLSCWAQQDSVPEVSGTERLLEIVLLLTPSEHRGVVRIMLDVLE